MSLSSSKKKFNKNNIKKKICYWFSKKEGNDALTSFLNLQCCYRPFPFGHYFIFIFLKNKKMDRQRLKNKRDVTSTTFSQQIIGG